MRTSSAHQRGEPVGTRFTATLKPVESRKRYILTGGKAGRLVVDPRPMRCCRGSLLPAGMIR
jgi:hypothetical protein